MKTQITKLTYSVFSIVCLYLSFLTSCTKEDNIANEQAEVSFDFKGKHYEFKGNAIVFEAPGVYAAKNIMLPGSSIPNDVYYSISGSTQYANFVIWFPTDTLKTISYHHVLQNVDIFTLEGRVYSIGTNNDYLDVNITGYNNQIVNGTFNGKVSTILSPTSYTTQQETITNGQIKNLKMHYTF